MSSYQVRKTPGNTDWFRHDRFGMFIHWGIYALPARHEWVKTYEQMPEEAYQRYFDHFEPDLFDPADWARKAKAAGMRYAVFTAKHHDGFCLFDSQYTDYKSTNTKAKKDLVLEYLDAFRAEGLKVGLYYSLIDWHHPQFPLDLYHPRRNDPDAYEQNRNRDIKIYTDYLHKQVRELLTNYGKIDILWFDFSYPDYKGEGEQAFLLGKGKDDWQSEKLIAMARSLQPGVIIDNRAGIEQDLWTPEQYQPLTWLTHKDTGELVTWEACQTFSGSWGYHREETSWKSPEMLVQMLISTVALGGNLLLNVGPTARGYLDTRAVTRLQVIGEWMHYHSRSIYGCTMAEPDLLKSLPLDCRFTQSQDGKRLYLHLFTWPYAYVQLPGLAGKIAYAQFLHDGSELKTTEGKVNHFSEGASKSEDLLVIEVPTRKPDVLVPVIEIFLK